MIVLCLTLLVFTSMVRGSLCKIRVQQGNTVMVASLNYGVRG
nr:Hok/Gef family protein [Pectobacterium atrosepticum]